ncbi:MAG: LemA family protein [Acidobacteriota bacterium]
MRGDFLWLVLPIIVLVVLGILAYLSKARRNLLRLRIEIDKTGASLDALLKHRHDELPKLIGTCRGYMPHDHPAFEALGTARGDYLKAHTLQEKTLANLAMAGAIENLFKCAGDFAGLKSNSNFAKFRKQNSELETGIEEQQDLFNALVSSYNTRIRRFPESIAARMAHLEPRQPIADLNPGSEA